MCIPIFYPFFFRGSIIFFIFFLLLFLVGCTAATRLSAAGKDCCRGLEVVLLHCFFYHFIEYTCCPLACLFHLCCSVILFLPYSSLSGDQEVGLLRPRPLSNSKVFSTEQCISRWWWMQDDSLSLVHYLRELNKTSRCILFNCPHLCRACMPSNIKLAMSPFP